MQINVSFQKIEYRAEMSSWYLFNGVYIVCMRQWIISAWCWSFSTGDDFVITNILKSCLRFMKTIEISWYYPIWSCHSIKDTWYVDKHLIENRSYGLFLQQDTSNILLSSFVPVASVKESNMGNYTYSETLQWRISILFKFTIVSINLGIYYSVNYSSPFFRNSYLALNEITDLR